MSHYSVAVFTVDGGLTVEELLEPFDENTEVPRYMEYTKAALIAEERKRIEEYRDGTYAEYLKDPAEYLKKCGGDPNSSHYRYISQEFPKKLEWTDEEVYQDAIKYHEPADLDAEGNVYSTYNPKSKWDWYSFGGRFEADFIMKDGVDTEDEDFDPDYIPVKDIDFEAMRRESLENLTPYEEFMSGDHFYNKEYLQKLYPDEETYVKMNTGFKTYAAITPDGEWHAPGDVGWFGMSSETPEESQSWDFLYEEKLIKPAIENNWRISIVDCHI